MKIKIQEIPADGICIALSEHPVGLDGESLRVAGPIDGKVFIKKQSEDSVYVRGSLSTRLLLSCRRCLSFFGHPIQTEFALDYTHPTKGRSGQERQLYKEEMDLHFYRGDTLNLDEIIENQLYLETPMAPLCKEDCQGLCSACGEDLNNGAHICAKR